MKNLLACLAVFAACTAWAQSSAPWNPDANDDSYVGATDMLSTLAVYGQQVGIDSSLTCDYDGTPFEEFLGDVFDNAIILDSLMLQYHCFAVTEVYFPSCPETYPDTISYERAYTLYPESSLPNERRFYSGLYGYPRRVIIGFAENSGAFSLRMWDDEVELTGLDVFLGHRGCSAINSLSGENWYLPFPEEYEYSETGVSYDSWSGFLSTATFCTILPHWHYAE